MNHYWSFRIRRRIETIIIAAPDLGTILCIIPGSVIMAKFFRAQGIPGLSFREILQINLCTVSVFLNLNIIINFLNFTGCGACSSTRWNNVIQLLQFNAKVGRLRPRKSCTAQMRTWLLKVLWVCTQWEKSMAFLRQEGQMLLKLLLLRVGGWLYFFLT